jgi:acetyltransferase-like isoleucine patch superfamily enzyme
MLRNIYLSPFGIFISLFLNGIAALFRPFMIYGYFDQKTNAFRKNTRVSSTAILENRRHICIADHVWIGHYNVLDGSNEIFLGEGCQLAANVSIFTHSSDIAIRLYGKQFIRTPHNEREGYSRDSVKIGDYCFVGTGATIMPGVVLGRGCVVAAHSVVKISAPDYSILLGTPAKIVGDVREIDQTYLKSAHLRATYFDRDVIRELFGDTSGEAIRQQIG